MMARSSTHPLYLFILAQGDLQHSFLNQGIWPTLVRWKRLQCNSWHGGNIQYTCQGIFFLFSTLPACLSPSQTSGKVASFRDNGFVHYNLMSNVMPKKVKGAHTFRASQQSRGAASSVLASSSKGKKGEKGKGKGKGKGKEKENGTGVDLELNDDSDGNDNDKPNASLPPPRPSNAIPSSSTSTSASKWKYSALDGDSSNLSGLLNSSSKKAKAHSSTAIDGVSAGLENIGNSIRDMTTECKFHWVQQEARANAQATQAAQQLASSPQCRHEAMQHLQQTKSYPDPNHMIALVDLISSDTIAADVYMTLEWEDYCRAWISKRLKELGFVNRITVST